MTRKQDMALAWKIVGGFAVYWLYTQWRAQQAAELASKMISITKGPGGEMRFNPMAPVPEGPGESSGKSLFTG